MPAQYSPAPAVAQIAAELIPQHHAHLLQYGVTVAFVFRDDIPKRNGRAVAATARKIGGLNAYLAHNAKGDSAGDTEANNEPFFCIVTSKPIWEDFTHAQRRALVDHELKHCLVEEDEEGNPKLKLLGHDRELFIFEIEEHGLWDEGLKAVGEAVLPYLRDRINPQHNSNGQARLVAIPGAAVNGGVADAL